MKFLIFFAIGFLPAMAISQTFSLTSNTQGTLKTTDGKFEGIIDVNLDLDQVLWTKDNTTKIFGARQIKEVLFKNNETGEEKVYCGMEFDDEYHLFEVLSSGKVTILYHPDLTMKDDSNNSRPSYFAINKGRKAIPLRDEKDFLDLLGNDAKWMKLHIKNHQYDLTEKEDIIRTFHYYNDL